MDRITRNKINDIADIITQSLDIKAPIEDMEELVTRLRGNVERKKDLPECAEGRIFKVKDSFVIQIPEYKNKNRERFTIAHELGHLFLHMGYLIDDDLWNRSNEQDFFRRDFGEVEYQAHEFAAALLMPREEFYKKMNESYMGAGEYDMEEVSKYFGVSIEAAVNRGRWLGVLEWR